MNCWSKATYSAERPAVINQCPPAVAATLPPPRANVWIPPCVPQYHLFCHERSCATADVVSPARSATPRNADLGIRIQPPLGLPLSYPKIGPQKADGVNGLRHQIGGSPRLDTRTCRPRQSWKAVSHEVASAVLRPTVPPDGWA